MPCGDEFRGFQKPRFVGTAAQAFEPQATMQYNRATSSATGRVANEPVPPEPGRCAALRERAQCAPLIAPYGAGYGLGALRGDAASGSTSLILSPPQTAARVETFMIAVLPQAGQRQRNANGEAAG